MVMTRPDDDAATQTGDPPRRMITRAPGVPSGRALLGGALVAVAAVGLFLTWRGAGSTPAHRYAVAARALAPGDPVGPADVRFAPIDLPHGVARAAFPDAAALEGRVALAPIGAGELLQQGELSDQVAGPPAAEVSLRLDRALAVDGRLRPGDRVDVFGTDEQATHLVASGVRVIASDDAGGSFGAGDQLTVTLALTDGGQQQAVVSAARAGTVTLVRTTHAGPTASATGAPSGAPAGGAPGGAGAGAGATPGTVP